MSLIERSTGTAITKGWRQFLHGPATPIARVVEIELSDKFNVLILLNLDTLFVSDLSAPARVLLSMVGDGMDVDKVSGLAGLVEDGS